MIVALLVSLTLPLVISSVNEATSGMTERRMAEIAEDIASTVERMAVAGPGNVRVLEVPMELPSGASLFLGGANGTVDSSRISWTVDGVGGSRYLEGVTVVTKDGSPLTLVPGSSLRLICPVNIWGTVEAEPA